jgi:hypothetical protein
MQVVCGKFGHGDVVILVKMGTRVCNRLPDLWSVGTRVLGIDKEVMEYKKAATCASCTLRFFAFLFGLMARDLRLTLIV